MNAIGEALKALVAVIVLMIFTILSILLLTSPLLLIGFLIWRVTS